MTNSRLEEEPDTISPILSVVVPVYRSHGTLEKLYIRVRDAIESIDPGFELILVEDCGGDDSWSVIVQLAAADPRIRGVKMSRNFGQHAATLCGISKARGEWIVTLDDDLEHKPEYIPELFEKAQDGYDLVYAVYPDRSHSWWRNATSDIGRRLLRIAIPSLNHQYSSFRCIRKEVAHQLLQFDSSYPAIDGYLSWLTNNYGTVNIEHGVRLHGISNYNFSKLLKQTITTFVTFSDLPLKLASWIGLFSFFFGMIWLSMIVIGRITGWIALSGFASLMGGIILFGGVQLLVLGVIGEYLGRMNFRLSRKPLFLISAETSQDKDSANSAKSSTSRQD